MFSNTVEYALRAVAHLALHAEAPCSAEAIARSTQAPRRYLSKVLEGLVRAGIVDSQRGPSGGYTLLRQPGKLTVLDVINAVDPIERIKACPLGIPSHGTRLCRLHRRLDETIAQVERTLAESTIADMVDRPSEHECGFPLGARPVTDLTIGDRSARSTRRRAR